MDSQVRPGRPSSALGHPLRAALLDLLSRRATLTSTQAARELGESSGACSFHLRQLARFGQVEPVPGDWGRARPWRIAAGPAGPAASAGGGEAEFGELARELEDEGYRRWLAGRAGAPPGWRDEAFSTVLHLTPERLGELAIAIRAVVESFAAGQREGQRDGHRDVLPDGLRAGEPAGPPRGGGQAAVLPVGVVARLFPLLPPAADG